jgi:hypothetical protein
MKKFNELYTVIWTKAIIANIMKSWQMWTAYIYIGAGAMFDYMPAFRHALGPHYNRVFIATGIIMVILRFKTKKPIVMKKEEAVDAKINKDIDAINKKLDERK